ncbi:enoyl-CoA hydratase/isomerase family protein [Bacilli bacterium]|uniref:enoyl-CoA hydratase/isomerase family protein n=1 Tax=Bacillaceae TaxID=186817 RepID=UPI000621EF58|nr:enoyl-CoA hydratase-related protein [Virgibacillus sp. SK37]KKE78480.1 enoyl-CoA hydratase [Bacilli bacterium VT-13-104]PZD85404.1 enoyl-CoA hydratase/isomerase family protein [Bacilli bacterium]PZD89128.1 enoyl-CoA hydratase/isomerase family protein [Bacilli bacterium]PZD91701.1 enoyl-CoA hydratase/isomerase family protein [Bacilli bacterium]RCO06150.1 enoyl-CoA hydratase/isomerase family protein [Bacilli bacterium]
MEPVSYVDVEIQQGIYFLTLNRMEARNALDAKMLAEIEGALDEAEKSQDVKVIVVQGAGGKSFAAGADIKQLQARKPLEALVPGMQGLYQKIENCSKVTIAAVDGYTLGGGCELALACDIRIATKNAKFGLPELNLGIIPGAGGTQRLARVIGKGRALDMILTGKMIDGEEAERIGLVTYYVEREELKEKIEEVASQIMRKGPVAIQLAKHAVHKGYDLDMETALWIEKLSQSIAFGTEDKQEGTTAFIEKRQAEFQNK